MKTKDSNKKTAVLVRCMDKRHTDKIGAAIKEKIGDYNIYELTEPGGAGVLADIFPEAQEWLLKKIGVTVGHLHAEEILLAVHGVSSEDMNGCGGYKLSGFAEHYETPEKSRAFSAAQLKKASQTAQEKFPNVPVRAFYVTFDAGGNNIVEEVQI